jgi:ribosomal protein S5
MSNVNIVKVTAVQCSLRSKQSSLSVLMKEATQGVGPKPLLG